jgi:uncharacterized protein YndB with AHSA1/START domain
LTYIKNNNTMAEITQTDFSQFKLRVNIKTSIENAYRAWATPAGLSSWFLGKVVFTDASGNARGNDDFGQENDDYSFYVYRPSNPDKIVVSGKVLKANDKDVFSFTFSKGCPVSVTIYSEHNETMVELLESRLPTDEETIRKHYVGDSRGWIFYLTNLKSVLEGGLDLRNKNEFITNVITR